MQKSMKYTLLILFILASASTVMGPIFDPDLGWHIAAGRWILSQGQVPSVDIWNMYAEGTPWRAYSWSNEIVFAAVEGAAGLTGLLVLKYLLALGLFLTLFITLSSVAKDRFVGGALAVYVTAASSFAFSLRPQTLMWVLFVLYVYWLRRVETDGFGKKHFFAFMLIMCAWANTHLSTVIPIGIGVLYFVRLQDLKQELIEAGKVFWPSFLGTLLTPYFGAEWLTFFSKINHPLSFRWISEFMPSTIDNYATGMAICMLLVTAFLVHAKPRLVHPTKMLIGGFIFFVSLAVIKFLSLALIWFAFLISEFWGSADQASKEDDRLMNGVLLLQNALPRLPSALMAAVLMLFIVSNSLQVIRNPLEQSFWPKDAVDFLLRKNLPGPVLNGFGDGGYLIYRFARADGTPTRLVPIDGRTNVTDPKIMRYYFRAFTGTVHWQQYIDEVQPGTIIWRKSSPLHPLLLQSEEWCRVYEDRFPEPKKKPSDKGTSPKEEEEEPLIEKNDVYGRVIFVRRSYFEKNQDRLQAPDCKSELQPMKT